MIGFPKGRPAALLRQDRKKARTSLDEKESAKVRARSDGRCEVWTQLKNGRLWIAVRCNRKAVHVHHMLGGWGVRGRGESAKAERKQHVCYLCHNDIGWGKLQRIGSATPHFQDRYRRPT